MLLAVLRPTEVDPRTDEVLRVEILVVNVQRMNRTGDLNVSFAVMTVNEENCDHHRESEIDEPHRNEKERETHVHAFRSTPVGNVVGLHVLPEEVGEIRELPQRDEDRKDRFEQRGHLKPTIATQIQLEDDHDLRNLFGNGPEQVDRVRTNTKALFGFQTTAANNQKDQLNTSNDNANRREERVP